jgi:hypothetical protein
MISQKITYTSVIAAIAIASIALVVGLSQTQSTTAQSAPVGNNVYVFGEGVYPQATFGFRDGAVTYDFQIYDTTNNLFSQNSAGGLGKQVAPEFTLARIVGDTPYLHEAVDQTFEYGGKVSGFDYPYKEFDVMVNMVQAGESVRSMEYSDCSVTNYKINTRTDNEEGYVTGGKTGFALVETYTFVCTGFTPHSPLYDQLVQEKQNRKPYQ